MTKLLDRAVDAARRLSPREQDEIALAIIQLAGGETSTVPLTEEERRAIDASRAAAARGEFATDDDVQRAWAKHGL